MPKASFDDCYDSTGRFICTHTSTGSTKEPLNSKQRLLNSVSKAREFNNQLNSEITRKNYSDKLSEFINDAVDHPFTRDILESTIKTYEDKFNEFLNSRLTPQSRSALDRARTLAGKSKMTANATEVPQDVIDKAHAVGAAYEYSQKGHKAAQQYLDDNNVRMTIDPEVSHDRAIALVHKDTGKVSIAYRGTQLELKDLGADLLIAGGLDDVNPALKTANGIYERVKAKYGEIAELLGHSLGGFLATKTGDRHDVPTTTFNAAISVKQLLERKHKYANNVNGHQLWSTTEDVVSILANPYAAMDSEKIQHNSIDPLDSTRIDPTAISVSPHMLHQFTDPGTNRTNAEAIKDRKRGHLEAIHSELLATSHAIKSKSYEDFLERGNYTDSTKSKNIYDSARGIDTPDHPDNVTTSAQRQNFVASSPIDQERTFESLNDSIRTVEHVQPKPSRLTHLAAKFRSEIGPRGLFGAGLSMAASAGVGGAGKAMGLSDETISQAQYAVEGAVSSGLAGTLQDSSKMAKMKTRAVAGIKGIGSAIIGDSVHQAVIQLLGDNLGGNVAGGATSAAVGEFFMDAFLGLAARGAAAVGAAEIAGAAVASSMFGPIAFFATVALGAIGGAISWGIGEANKQAEFKDKFKPKFEGSGISEADLWKMYNREMEIPEKAMLQTFLNDPKTSEAVKTYVRKIIKDEAPTVDEYLNYLQDTNPEKAEEERNRIEREQQETQQEAERQQQEETLRLRREEAERLRAQRAAQQAARANSADADVFDLHAARQEMNSFLERKVAILLQQGRRPNIPKLKQRYINNHLDFKQALLDTNPSLVDELETLPPGSDSVVTP